MAFENEEPVVLKDIRKNNRGDYIRITGIKDKDAESYKAVDIRNFYTGDDDELYPTKKGLRIPADKVLEIMDALNSVIHN